MKIPFVAAALLTGTLLVSNELAQGVLILQNRNLSQGLDSPVFDVDGHTPITGINYLAQAYVGLTADSLQPMFPLTQFGHPLPGYIDGQSIEVQGSGTRYFQLRVWESASGATYEAAVAAGAKHGESNISIIQAVPPPGAPGVPRGLQSFALVAEPSTIVLLAAGIVALIVLECGRACHGGGLKS